MTDLLTDLPPLAAAEVLAAGLKEIADAIALLDRTEADAAAGMATDAAVQFARGRHCGAVWAFFRTAEALGLSPHSIATLLSRDFRTAGVG